MNINKINKQWPVLCNDALATIDRMNTWEAYECGVFTVVLLFPTMKSLDK